MFIFKMLSTRQGMQVSHSRQKNGEFVPLHAIAQVTDDPLGQGLAYSSPVPQHSIPHRPLHLLKELTTALKHAGNWLSLQCCHIKRALSALIFELAGPRKIHLPGTHLHAAWLTSATRPCKGTGVPLRKVLGLPSVAHVTRAQREAGLAGYQQEVGHRNKHRSPRPLHCFVEYPLPSDKDGMSQFTWEQEHQCTLGIPE